ncbi:MAG: efflux RND transporter periplasmic adaptor subunit [Pseudohaliea sp.]
MLRTMLRISAPLAVIGLGLGAFTLLHATKPEPAREEPELRPTTVYTANVDAVDTELKVETQGEVRARTALQVVAQVGGRITTVSPEFTEGGHFDAGAVLIELEDSDYQLALRQAEAALAETELAVQQALADADVARRQLAGTPNPSALALKKPQIAQARARQAAAEAGLERARLDLARTRISLPFAGRVQARSVDVGQYVNAGTPLGSVFAVDTVEVRLPLTDRQLAALDLPIGYRAAAGEGRPVLFSADIAGRLHSWRGRLVRLDAAIDPATRLIYGMAEVDAPYGEGRSAAGMPLAVGLFVNAELAGRPLENALRIPAAALRPGNEVYVVNARDRLEMRSVRVLHQGREYAYIDGGLRAGEAVVTSALDNPIEGMALRGEQRPAFAAAGER